ncbi:MAG: hypothetical protein LW860_06730 [Xanthomonadaceae bacterium]|jgi:hypothetical protein|nr:hypothetical protein [Xanthomonadaceae bacterium]
MIRAPRLPEPADFDTKVRRPGARWLSEHPQAKRPKALWTPYTPTLADGYRNLCGYAAMLDPTGGTVDHYLSFANHRSQAYEWGNYRYASATMNSKKRTLDDTVLDPEHVRDGWFEILLPSLQLRATDQVPARLRAKAANTLKRLGLADGERVIRWRRSWYEQYQRGGLTLDGLRAYAPLIADAVERASQKVGH